MAQIRKALAQTTNGPGIAGAVLVLCSGLRYAAWASSSFFEGSSWKSFMTISVT